MGYRISYGNECKVEYLHWKTRTSKKKYITIGLITIITCLVISFQNKKIRHCLLPGNGAVTEESFGKFVYSIQNGTELGEAITTFCRDIVENAG